MRSLRRTNSHVATPPGGCTRWRRDVRLLALSRGISMAGAEAGHIALLALAWQLTGSASQASIVLLAAVVARIVGAPVTGWIGDHVDRRRVIVASELVAAGSFGALAFATSMWQLLAAVLVGQLAMAACGAAQDAATPNLAPAAELSWANSTLGMWRTVGHMLGPVAGGLVVAGFGARAAFALDATSSVLAAGVVLLIRGGMGGAGDPSAAPHTSSDDGGGSALLAGVRALVADPALRVLVVAWSGMCVCFAFVTAAELPLAVEFGRDEAGLGAIITSWCIGSLAGSWLARRVHVDQRGSAVLVGCCVTCGAVFAGSGVMPVFSGVLALMAVGGFAMSLGEVVESTLLQTRVEDAVRARAMTAYGAVMSAIWGTNLAFAGLLVEATSPGTAYVFAGSWCFVSAAGFVVLGRTLRAERLSYDLRLARPRHALETELAESA